MSINHISAADVNPRGSYLHVNVPDAKGRAPLHIACANGLIAIVKDLIKQSACLDDIVKETEETALYIALVNDKLDCAELLIKSGADINKPNKFGATALHIACMKGNVSIVKMLLDRKDLNIDSIHNDGVTALHIALNHGNLDCAELLIKSGADINKQNQHGWTPLHLACEKGYESIVKMLLDSKDLNINITNFQDNATALRIALIYGKLDCAELLIKNGADINKQNQHGWAPLHLACEKGYVSIVKMLLDRKDLNIDITTFQDNVTALQTALNKGKLDCATLLIENGAGIGIADNLGWTPLQLACEKNYQLIAKILLDRKADLNINSALFSTEETALYTAVSFGNLNCAKLLIENGADINKAEYRGWTPLHVASEKGLVEIVHMLLDRKAILNIDSTLLDTEDTALNIAIVKRKFKIARLLIDSGANVRKADNKGCTPLHLVIGDNEFSVYKSDLLTIVTSILRRDNAVANIPNFAGQTPFELLLRTDINSFDMRLFVEVFIANGVNLNVVTSDGNNPLHISVLNNQLNIVKLLTKGGVQLIDRNIYGETILDIAINDYYEKRAKGILPKNPIVFDIINMYANIDDCSVTLFRNNAVNTIKECKDGIAEEFVPHFLDCVMPDKNPLEFAILLNDPRISRGFLTNLGKERTIKLLSELPSEVAERFKESLTYDLDETHLAYKVDVIPDQPEEKEYQVETLLDMFDEITGFDKQSLEHDLELEFKFKRFVIDKTSDQKISVKKLRARLEGFVVSCRKRSDYAGIDDNDRLDFWTNIEKAITNTIKIVRNFEGSAESIYNMKARLLCEYLEITQNCGTRLEVEFDNVYFMNKSETDTFSLSALSGKKALPQTVIPESSIVTAELANQISLERVTPSFNANSKLTSLYEEEAGMIAEEHIFAILYDKLIHEDKRSDVVILPFGPGNMPPRDLSQLSPEVRFVISPCSVKDDKHNTVLVIDRNKEEYFYFDSLQFTTQQEFGDIINNFIDAGYINHDFRHNPIQGTRQCDEWSCGFHAVENAVRLVNGKLQDDVLNGVDLRKAYINNFSNFVKNVAVSRSEDVQIKSFHDYIYEKLSELRRYVLHSLVPGTNNSVHLIQTMLLCLTKYNIPVRQRPDFLPKDTVAIDIETSFRRKYQESILVTIKNFLKSEEYVRELFFEWLKDNGHLFEECSLPEEETKPLFDHIEKTGTLPEDATSVQRNLFEVFKQMPYSPEELSDESPRQEIVAAYFTPDFWMICEFEKIKNGEVFENLDPQLQQAIIESGMGNDLSIFRTGTKKEISKAKKVLLEKFKEINSQGKQIRDEDIYFLLQKFGVLNQSEWSKTYYPADDANDLTRDFIKLSMKLKSNLAKLKQDS